MGKPFDPQDLLVLVADRIAHADALAPCRGMV
jgi:hypothetical protein